MRGSVKPEPPTYFVSVDWGSSRRTSDEVVVSRRIVRSRAGLGFRIVGKARPTGFGAGFLTLRPQVGGRLVAFVFTSAEGGSGKIELWSADPLRRLASLHLGAPIRVEWIQGTDLLSVVEGDGDGYHASVYRTSGQRVMNLPRCMRVLSDPAKGCFYAVRYTVGGNVANASRSIGDMHALADCVRDGRVRLEAISTNLRLLGPLTTSMAIDRLLERGGVDQLAPLLSPMVRVTGYARNWAIPMAGPKGLDPATMKKRVFDRLGYPSSFATFLRCDVGDSDAIVSVAPSGAMLFSGRGDGLPGDRPGDRHWVAAWTGRSRRQIWVLPTTPTLRGVALWAR